MTSGSVTITAGRTTATLTVQTTADTTAETDKTLIVSITGTTLPAGVVIQTATAVGTIVDDDAIKVSIEDDTITEGTASNWFRVELSRAATADLVLSWSTGDDDTAGANQATERTDYEWIRGGRTTISAGRTWVNLVVDTYEDDQLEGDETYKVTITGVSLPVGVVIQTGTAVGTIKDNTVAVSLEQANQSAHENTGYSDMIVRLSREIYDSEVVVSLATSADDTEGAHQATAGTDYTAVTDGRVTIRRGQTRGDYRVTIANDSTPEETETFKVTMTAVTLPADAAIANATTIANIHDDDSANVFVRSVSAFEGSRMEFVAELTGAVAFDVSVWMFTREDGRPGSQPASEYTDFQPERALVTIPEGETKSAVLPVLTVGDNDVEDDETFLVYLQERRDDRLPAGMRVQNYGTLATIRNAETTGVDRARVGDRRLGAVVPGANVEGARFRGGAGLVDGGRRHGGREPGDAGRGLHGRDGRQRDDRARRDHGDAHGPDNGRPGRGRRGDLQGRDHRDHAAGRGGDPRCGAEDGGGDDRERRSAGAASWRWRRRRYASGWRRRYASG